MSYSKCLDPTDAKPFTGINFLELLLAALLHPHKSGRKPNQTQYEDHKQHSAECQQKGGDETVVGSLDWCAKYPGGHVQTMCRIADFNATEVLAVVVGLCFGKCQQSADDLVILSGNRWMKGRGQRFWFKLITFTRIYVHEMV